MDLARSQDMRVKRNATGALLNLTHIGEYVKGIAVLTECRHFVFHHGMKLGVEGGKSAMDLARSQDMRVKRNATGASKPHSSR